MLFGGGGGGALGDGEDGVDDVVECGADGPDHVGVGPFAVLEGGSRCVPAKLVQDLHDPRVEPRASQEGEDVEWDRDSCQIMGAKMM